MRFIILIFQFKLKKLLYVCSSMFIVPSNQNLAFHDDFGMILVFFPSG